MARAQALPMTDPAHSTHLDDEDREDALRYAANRRALSLIRMADGSYALARYERTGATLDDIEDYLFPDALSEREQQCHRADEQRAAAAAQGVQNAALQLLNAPARKERVSRGTSSDLPTFNAADLAIPLSVKTHSTP